jgi:hypothetical protein
MAQVHYQGYTRLYMLCRVSAHPTQHCILVLGRLLHREEVIIYVRLSGAIQ